MAVVYAFGGAAALVALLSKFVVTPLFDQLTADRRLYAQAARQRLEDLNLQLSGIVSKVPSVQSVTKGLVDAQTQTENEFEPKPKLEEQDWLKMQKLFDTIEAGDDEKSALQEIDKFEEYLRSLMYGLVDRLEPSKPKSNALGEFQTEIRSFKGALLSL